MKKKKLESPVSTSRVIIQQDEEGRERERGEMGGSVFVQFVI